MCYKKNYCHAHCLILISHFEIHFQQIMPLLLFDITLESRSYQGNSLDKVVTEAVEVSISS